MFDDIYDTWRVYVSVIDDLFNLNGLVGSVCCAIVRQRWVYIEWTEMSQRRMNCSDYEGLEV